MEGQVKFFETEKRWGLITDPKTNQLCHVHINDVVDHNYLERNQWVSFDILDRNGRLSAVDVVPIGCPPQYLLQGTVVRYIEDRGFGFIAYESNSERKSVFFHLNDFLRVDGVEPVPMVGCLVSFCLGEKNDRPIAAQVWIERWPVNADPSAIQDVEKYFEEAPELPVEIPEPITAPQPSVLAEETKNVPIIELIRRRREGKI